MIEISNISPDIANACFEFLGACFLTLNCVKLYKDKMIMGVSVIPTTFYASWGVFNLWFYPITGNYWSAVAGVLVVISNTTWIFMALHYLRKNRNEQTVTNQQTQSSQLG